MPSVEDNNNNNDDDDKNTSYSGRNDSELEPGISSRQEEESNTPIIVGSASNGGTVELQMREEEVDPDNDTEDVGSKSKQSSAAYIRQYSANLQDGNEKGERGSPNHDFEAGDSSYVMSGDSSHDGAMSLDSLYSEDYLDPSIRMETATRLEVMEDNEASDCLAPLPHITSTSNSRMSSRTSDRFSSSGSLVRSDSKSTLMR